MDVNEEDDGWPRIQAAQKKATKSALLRIYLWNIFSNEKKYEDRDVSLRRRTE
jgi:hypothetical protein